MIHSSAPPTVHDAPDPAVWSTAHGSIPFPWWCKILGKIVASRLPVSYSSWARLGAFRHGGMAEYSYARAVFDFHRSQIQDLPPEPVCLEIGPGDALSTAILANRAGFARTILIDAERYANTDLATFALAARRGGIAEDRITRWKSCDDALADLNAVYLTDGLASLRSLPDDSVHFIFSHAVLEHIRRAEYPLFIAEMKRVLTPGGVASHQIDLQDHLSGGLNNLRFPDWIWERPLFSVAGFYTNRLSCSEHRAAFEDAGFSLRSLTRQTFNCIPIDRHRLAAQFSNRSDEDLAVLGLHLVAIV